MSGSSVLGRAPFALSLFVGFAFARGAALAWAADGAGATSPAVVLSPFVAWLLRAFGALLIIYGLFTVPGDHKKYQNYLVGWWAWVEQRRDRGLKWQTAFLQVVATVMASAFDRLFGHALLSRRAVAASITLSLASVHLGLGVAAFAILERQAYVYFFAIGACALSVLALWIVTRGSIKALTIFNVAVLAIITGGILSFRGAGRPDSATWQMLALFAGLVLSLLSDFLFIAATRWVLRVSQSAASATKIIAFTGLNVVTAGILVGAPLQVILATADIGFVPKDWVMSNMVLNVAGLVTLCNALDGVVALSAITLGFLMLIHRAVWPILGRPIEVIYSEHILLKRWPLFFTGLTVLGVSWAPFGAWLKLFQGK